MNTTTTKKEKKKKNHLMYENKINLVFTRIFDFLIRLPN
jgi:hypothetical protein